MTTGTVKWFNTNKGYGFISPDGGKKDVFVHITELEKSGIRHLNDGQRVNFEIETTKGRESAVKIKTDDSN